MLHYYVVFTLMFFLSLAILLIQNYIPPENYWYELLAQVSSALMAGSVISILFKLIVDRENDEKIAQILSIHQSVFTSGLYKVFANHNDYNFSKVINSSKILKLALNDGRSWTAKYHPRLVRRFSTPGTSTDIYIVDADGPFVHVLGKKYNKDIDFIKVKLSETISNIKRAYNESDKLGAYRVFAMKNFPTNSLFLTEEEVIITPYQIASRRYDVPLYVYKKNNHIESIYNDIIDDFNSIELESTLICSSA